MSEYVVKSEHVVNIVVKNNENVTLLSRVTKQTIQKL